MPLTVEQMAVVTGHVNELYKLLNVVEDKDLLLQVMSINDVEECIQSGVNNMERIKYLCKKLVLNENAAL